MSDGARRALVVSCDRYEDSKLRTLPATSADADAMARALGNPEIGGFEVDVSKNEEERLVRRRLTAFFRDRRRDDLLVLHLSCHGLKDDEGNLHFATTDTEVDDLDATSIASEFVNRQMARSLSRRIVLLLDCCYSGAFAGGMLSKAGDTLDLKERFDGRGRIVLTASTSMEFAWVENELTGSANPSIFTSALVHGLETGCADRNRDGWITVEELYDYAYERVRQVTPKQTPGQWTFDVQGELYLARSSLEPDPPHLPPELQSAIESPYSKIRLGAVEELARLARGSEAGGAAAAREALEMLQLDDSKSVSEAAGGALVEPPPWTEKPVVSARTAPVRRARFARARPVVGVVPGSRGHVAVRRRLRVPVGHAGTVLGRSTVLRRRVDRRLVERALAARPRRRCNSRARPRLSSCHPRVRGRPSHRARPRGDR